MAMDGIKQFNTFLAIHKPQLETSGIPQHFWPYLYRKLTTEVFDAGSSLQLMHIEYDDDDGDDNTDAAASPEEIGEEEGKNKEDDENKEFRPVSTLTVISENGIKASDSTAIFLIDHAWTFRMNMARIQLEEYDLLVDRLSAITGVDTEDPERIDKLLKRLWNYCHTYSIARDGLSDEERVPIWYVMDEVGSAINHSDNPNFRLVPFLYLNTQMTYCILFPIRDCEHGEQVTRDFAEFIPKDTPMRDAWLLPWRYVDLRSESFVQTEPHVQYFLSGHIPETYPNTYALEPEIKRNEPLKVYSEYDVLRENLTSSEFALVDNEAEADVLWLTRHYKCFAEHSEMTPNKFINQFPFEYVITIKDLLSIVGRRAAQEHHNTETLETYPSWLPTTYNLTTELTQFVSYYQHRQARGLDNHWIIKPWNLARGLDTNITNDLRQIVRLPSTGPKIAQKYIERPVLFYRNDLDAQVKFDIRYMLLLKSAQPLESYVHRSFFLRFANRPFSLDEFDDYEKHYTVMNYQENAELYHIKCEDFVKVWDEQYPEHKWAKINEQICEMLYDLLNCATKAPPPCGVTSCPQSRALYAADIMLEWSKDAPKMMQPKLLEVNWTPDCKRACDYYPEFFNDIFKLLFLDQCTNENFIHLSDPDR